MRSLGILVTVTASAVACPVMSAPTYGAGSARYDLAIEQQPLSAALQEFAKQSGVQIIFFSRVTDGHEAPSLKGKYTAASALQLLLNDSKLTFREINSKTIEVHPTAAVNSLKRINDTTASANRGGTPGGVLRLAQATSTSSAATGDGAARVANEGKLEEVIVTAQKREERLKDVPISMSVLGGEALDKSAVQGVSDALRRVPGVGVIEAAAGGGNAQLIVRGATNPPTFAGTSPVAYYVDSIPFGFVRHSLVPDANVYDLERVEVLRGPQGTLYGAGGAAGVVRVLTKDADPSAFELKARTSVSTTEDSDGVSYRGDMTVNMPVVDDRLAVRATVGYNESAGWIDAPTRKDINDSELTNFRLRIKAHPTEDLSIGLLAWQSRTDSGALALSDETGRFNSDIGMPSSNDFDAYGATVNYQFSSFTVTSTTSYIEYLNEFLQDLSFLLGSGTTIKPEHSSRVFSQEVVLNSASDGPWEWSLGVFYRDAEDHTVQTLFRPTVTSLNNKFRDASESYAVFGELHRRFLSDQLKLTVGLRQFHDDRIMETEVPIVINDASTSEALTPRAVLSWFPSRDLTLYASYAQGYRSGLSQSPNALAAIPSFPAAKPDKLHNFEIGTKGSFLDQRLTLEAALYYIDWQDIQQVLTVFFPSGLFGAGIVNGVSASGPGVELSLSAEVVKGLSLGASFSWNDLAFDADVVSGTSLVFVKGERMPSSPEYTAGGFAEYAFPIGGSGFLGRLSGSVNYTSSLRGGSLVERETSNPVLLGAVSLSIDAPEHWSATLYAENINNESDAAQPAPTTAAWTPRIRPRTVGMQVEYKF
jgi:iron complex outermembrane recepter protein